MLKFKGDKKLRLSPPNTGLALHSERRPNTKPHYKTPALPHPNPRALVTSLQEPPKKAQGLLEHCNSQLNFLSLSLGLALVIHIVQSNCQFRPAKRGRTWLRRNPNRETEMATCCGNSGGGHWKDIGLVLPLILLLLCSASLTASVQDCSRAPKCTRSR